MRTKKQQQRGTKEVQLSLFDTDMREKSDRELIAELTPHAESVAEDWEWSYNMERLYNQLTPHRRRIAAAAVELYRRREGRKRNATPIRSSADIHQLMCPYVAHLEVEEFWVLPLSQAMRVMQPVRIASGGIDTTVADVRTIMRKLLEVGATNFAIVHNHPSGCVIPSNADKKLTGAVRDAAKLLNIRLVDHVIIGSGSYYSFADEGLM